MFWTGGGGSGGETGKVAERGGKASSARRNTDDIEYTNAPRRFVEIGKERQRQRGMESEDEDKGWTGNSPIVRGGSGRRFRSPAPKAERKKTKTANHNSGSGQEGHAGYLSKAPTQISATLSLSLSLSRSRAPSAHPTCKHSKMSWHTEAGASSGVGISSEKGHK